MNSPPVMPILNQFFYLSRFTIASGSARRKDMKDILNQRIKFREHFRPFCPSILADRVGEYFETDYPSPFMVMAYKIKPAQRE